MWGDDRERRGSSVGDYSYLVCDSYGSASLSGDWNETSYEHDYFNHGSWLYHGELAVPFIMSCAMSFPWR